jgi:transcription initiation factor IIE alpha subunit
MNKRIYLSSPTMHGLEMKYIQEAFDTNWVAPLGQNVDEIVRIIKSLTARGIFRRHTKIKRDILWEGSLWTSGYYANTVGLYAGKETIRRYIENQGRQEDYTQLYSSQIKLDFNP